MTIDGEPLVKRLYSLDELVEMRRNTLRFARTFPPGNERDRHRQVATSLQVLFRDKKCCGLTRPEARLFRNPFRFGTNAGRPN